MLSAQLRSAATSDTDAANGMRSTSMGSFPGSVPVAISSFPGSLKSPLSVAAPPSSLAARLAALDSIVTHWPARI